MYDTLVAISAHKYIIRKLYLVGFALLIISGFVWWLKVYENPYNIYWDMLKNSLETTGVTKHVTEESNNTTLDQYIMFNFGTSNLAHARTSLKNSSGTVTTENIGTIQNDYVQYVSVAASSGNKQDFSKVINKWAMRTVTNDNTNTDPSFFIQTVVGFDGGNVIPIANLPVESRSVLLDQLHNDVIFNVSFDKVKQQIVHGRPIYNYPVSIELVGYVAFQKAFAKEMGIKALDAVDPNSYQGKDAINVQFLIDGWSHELTGIVYPGVKHTETFNNYGIRTNVTEPKTTISTQALQALFANTK
jgi:hypothetical protein